MKPWLGTCAAVLAVASGLTACGGAAEKPPAPAMSKSAPAMSAARTGTFTGLNGRQVAGTATLRAGQLVLSGFSADEGADLHIYLTAGTDGDAVSAGESLGAVAYDKASQTFSVPAVDTSGYGTVVVYSDTAKLVFGAAKLT